MNAVNVLYTSNDFEWVSLRESQDQGRLVYVCRFGNEPLASSSSRSACDVIKTGGAGPVPGLFVGGGRGGGGRDLCKIADDVTCVT